MKSQSHTKGGFTLIELLTVIAIVAILSAILVPTVGQFRTLAKKTSDANDLRRIVQASQMFAAQNGERFVDINQTIGTDGNITTAAATTINDVAGVLAIGGELNDIQIWVSENEQKTLTGGAIYTVTPGAVAGDPSVYSLVDRTPNEFSFDYVTGLATYMPATTPVAFSRKKTLTSPLWEVGDVYDASGGHIAFLGGNVSWFEDLGGKLIAPNGDVANDLDTAIPDTNTDVKASASQ